MYNTFTPWTIVKRLNVYMAAIRNADMINTCDKNGYSLLLHAVKRRNHAAAEKLLGPGADPDLAGRYGWAPVYEAAKWNDINMIQLLARHQANVQKTVTTLYLND